MLGRPEIRDMPANSLEGRVALVTGSTTGLGFAVARAMGQAGARVVLNFANNEARAATALEALRSVEIEATCIRASVTDEGEVDRLCSETEAVFGPIDIAVFNATPAQPLMPIEDYDWTFYQSMLDFFVKSPFLLTRRILPHLKEQRWGRIINIGSEVFRRGVSPFSAYVAAKGALAEAATSRGTLVKAGSDDLAAQVANFDALEAELRAAPCLHAMLVAREPVAFGLDGCPIDEYDVVLRANSSTTRKKDLVGDGNIKLAGDECGGVEEG